MCEIGGKYEKLLIGPLVIRHSFFVIVPIREKNWRKNVILERMKERRMKLFSGGKNVPLLHEKKNISHLRSENKKKKRKRKERREMIGAVPVSKTTKEIELSQRSTDGITSLSFCPGSDELLAVSSWDSVNYIY